MEKQGDRILEAAIKTYTELRDATLDTIFSLADCGSISKYDALYTIESNNLLPLGGAYYESPECLNISDNKRDYHRCEIVSFVSELEYYYSREDAQKYIDEVYAYVKEHRIIGTVFEW